MSRILVTHDTYVEVDELVAAAGHEVVHSRPSTPAELVEAARDVHGVIATITDRFDREVLDDCQHLTVLANAAAGYDNIDVGVATGHGITVTNTPDVLTEATADLAFALLLGAARRLPEGDRHVREGRWDRWRFLEPLMGHDVAGRTIGIVGMGRIGRAVARRAHLGFGMEVLYHNRASRDEVAERELGARAVDLPTLAARSDFVSLHAPLNDATHHLVDAAFLQRMKPTSILINTARGPLVDESALAQALAAGTIAGAGLDVFEDEPQVSAELIELTGRVVLMPHVGSATDGTRRAMATTAARNAVAVLDGHEPPNPVVVAIGAR